jgi:hypothetical protein
MHAIEAALRKSDTSATDVRQTRATDAAHNSPGHEAGAYRGCKMHFAWFAFGCGGLQPSELVIPFRAELIRCAA